MARSSGFKINKYLHQMLFSKLGLVFTGTDEEVLQHQAEVIYEARAITKQYQPIEAIVNDLRIMSETNGPQNESEAEIEAA